MNEVVFTAGSKPATRRLLLVAFCASVFAHALLLGALPDFTPETPAPTQALVATLVAPTSIAPTAIAPKPAAKTRARTKPASAAAPTEPPAITPPSVAAPPQNDIAPALPAASAVPAPVETTPAQTIAAAPVLVPAAVAQTEPLPVPPQPAEVPATPPQPPSDPPESVRLRYSVVATDTTRDPERKTYGKGSVSWQRLAGRYALDLDASVTVFFLSIDVLASHSEGLILPAGLAPTRYTESPRRRATVATNFNRDPASPLTNTITYSASTNSQPLAAGAQDRLSVIFQLAGLLRANPPWRIPGQEVRIYVAGVRGDAEYWTFSIKGMETLNADGTPLQGLRAQRLARPESNDRALDVWFAIEQGGYPIQIRYSETNGNRVDLLLSGID